MKSVLFIIGSILSMQMASAQLKATPVCPVFDADVLAGTVNRLSAKSTMGEVQKTLPCFTDIVEKADSNRCAAISYTDKGLYFFPERNYIEIRENFKGKLTPAIMGTARGSLFKTLGFPVLKDVNWDAYQTEYGTLVLYYKSGKINKIQISSRSTATLKLCE